MPADPGHAGAGRSTAGSDKSTSYTGKYSSVCSVDNGAGSHIRGSVVGGVLASKIALVTGSSRGLGFGLAEGLGAAGATVVINGRDRDRAEQAGATLRDSGIDARVVAFDVTDDESAQMAVDRIESTVGAIDILVNNAGTQIRGPLTEFAPNDWNLILSTNLTSAFLVSKAVANYMIPRSSGKIVNIYSLQSELGRSTIAPYAASKGGLKMLTRAMCVEWAKHNIQVNAIGPGYFATEMTRALWEDEAFDSWLKNRTPAGRWGDPAELLPALLLFTSPGSEYINGQILYVDGGITAAI